jgi:tight adherence protein B
MSLLVITFLCVLGISFGLAMVSTSAPAAGKNIERQLANMQHPLARTEGGTAQLEKVQRRDYARRLGDVLKQYEFSKKLQTLLVQANSSMTVGSLAIASCGAACGSAFLVWLFFHSWPFASIALIPGFALPRGFLQFQRASRLKAFDDALPEAIELMARSLRAGHAMSSAIELIAEQSPEPLAGEFVQVFQQQKVGMRFRDALLEMAGRIPSRDLSFLVTAILVQRETGGDLTEILDRTSHVIRERIRIQGEVRTHTAQGRLTGWILGLLPVIMLVMMNIVSPGYSELLFHDPTGQKLLYAGAILILIGGLIIRKVVDVRV